MRALTFLSLAFLLTVDAAAARAKKESKPAGYAQAQMRRGPQNHLVLRGSVNGHAATFLVDTGANISFLRSDRAQAFGVRRLGTQTERLGRTFPLGAIERLAAGDTTFGDTTVALADAGQWRGTLPGGGAADGVLGLDLLRRFEAIINCHTRQIFFQMNPAARTSLEASTRAFGFVAVPLEQSRRGYLRVVCRLRGRPGKLVVDTGAFVTGIDQAVARSLGMTTRPSRLTMRGLDGEVQPVALAQVDDLKIGGVAIAPQPFAVADLFGEKKRRRTYTGLGRIEYYTARIPEARLFGVLGNELLDQRRAIIDLGSMTLFLK